MTRPSARPLRAGLASSTVALALLGCTGTADGAGQRSADQRAAGTAATAPATRSRPAPLPCRAQRSWTTRAEHQGAGPTLDALYLTRVGRHDCYDRVVFDLNGPRDGAHPNGVAFDVAYVDEVRADPSGRPVQVPGRAVLRVSVGAPVLGADGQGHQPGRRPPELGESLVAPGAVTGWRALRAVAFAGSFEGRTTVAVGVRQRLPFRVWSSSEGDYQHVVVDIAHLYG